MTTMNCPGCAQTVNYDASVSWHGGRWHWKCAAVEARKHHKAHGDMDGKVCLLSVCPVHHSSEKGKTL